MSNQRKSWVWQYAERKGDKAYCNVCDEDDENELSCRGGTTGSVLRHLKQVHSINNSSWISLERRNSCDDSSMQNEENTNTSGKEMTSVGPSLSTVPSTSDAERSRKRRRHARSTKEEQHRPCTPDQTERIHQSLTQMVAMNQMPLSFCSSDGFKQFIAIVEPNYKICSEQSVKKRLHSLREAFKTAIKRDLSDAPAIACTSDCWSSRCQESYISMTAHFIDPQWKQKSFTLSVKEIEERHTASNLALCMDTIFHEWGIEDKIIAVVSDNASNITSAIKSLKNVTETADITCAAHSIQIAVNKALAIDNRVESVICKGSKIVSHFKHSNVAMYALESKQEQLGLSKETLLQSCKTRWNSVYFMLERLLRNRNPITNVLSDRSITSITTTQKLEVTERDWETMEVIIKILKLLQVVTTLFESEDASPVSMVRPVLHKMLENHFQITSEDDMLSIAIKQTVTSEIEKRFLLTATSRLGIVSARQIASLLDPRFKYLNHEPGEHRQVIRDYVKRKITAAIQNNKDNEEPTSHSTALEFIFQETSRRKNDPSVQFEDYLAEPQIRFDLDPFDWWRSREKKYPNIAFLAKKYLSIPATSASSERCFSAAGNIVTPKRTCLSSENVDILVFLHRNKSLFN